MWMRLFLRDLSRSLPRGYRKRFATSKAPHCGEARCTRKEPIDWSASGTFGWGPSLSEILELPLLAHPGPATYWSECPQGVRKLTSHSSYRVSRNRPTMAAGFGRYRNGRRRPNLFAITDNGSGRAGSGPRAWACLYCCHIQSCGSWPARLNQSSIWAVESTWSSCLPLGNDRQLVQVCSEPRRPLGQLDKAVLDHRGLRVHAHDLVAIAAGSG